MFILLISSRLILIKVFRGILIRVTCVIIVFVRDIGKMSVLSYKPNKTKITKPVAVAASVWSPEQTSAIAAVRALSTQSVSPPETSFDGKAPVGERADLLREVDSGYAAYISEGCVSLVGSGVKIPVMILRDTGSLDSFIVDSVLPFFSSE